jgi:hypothetical protein
MYQGLYQLTDHATVQQRYAELREQGEINVQEGDDQIIKDLRRMAKVDGLWIGRTRHSHGVYVFLRPEQGDL